MSTSHLDPAAEAGTPDSTNPVARIALVAVGTCAVFVAAYLATATLLTDRYDTSQVVLRLAIAVLAALVAVGSLVLARRRA